MKMKYPNAYIGVKRLFTSRVLAMIGLCVLLVSTSIALVISAIPKNSADSVTAAEGILAVLAIAFMMVSCVIMVVSYILGITGLSRASVDEPAFRIALFATVANIIFYGFGSIFSSLQNYFMASLLNSFSTIADLIVFIYTIQGIRSLAIKLGDKDIDRRGNNLFKILLVTIIVEFIANLIVVIFQGANTAIVIAGIIAIVCVLLTIIQYFMFLVYLVKAKKMLANAE